MRFKKLTPIFASILLTIIFAAPTALANIDTQTPLGDPICCDASYNACFNKIDPNASDFEAQEAACESSSNCKPGVCFTAPPQLPGTQTPGGSSGTPSGVGDVETYTLPNFLFTDDPSDVIGRVIEFVIGLTGTAALIMFIYGGVLWLISAGRDEYVQKGVKTMTWAAIGLAIVFSSYILVKFVLQLIGSSAGA